MLPTARRTLTAAIMLCSSTAMAADNPAAHQHGLAQLQLAISGNRIEAIFLSPAHNLLGFEHAPRTDEQRETVSQVTQWLSQTPLANTESGSCIIHSASIHHDEHEHHDEPDHDEHEHHDDHDHHDEHDHHGEEGHHEEHSGHSDFEVIQELDCPKLADAETLASPLMEQFPLLQTLDIVWAGPAGQGAVRLGQGDRNFTLKP